MVPHSTAGKLCASCVAGYGKTGDDCLECPSHVANTIIITLVTLLGVGIIVFMTKRALLRGVTREMDVARCVCWWHVG